MPLDGLSESILRANNMNHHKKLPWLQVKEAYDRILANLELVPNGHERLRRFAERCGIYQEKQFLQLAYLPDVRVMQLDQQLRKEVESNGNRSTTTE